MLYPALLTIAILAGAYLAFRYASLIYGMKKIRHDIQHIQQDLTQNQLLHLPIPDRHLKKLLCSFNSLLDDIQSERQFYLQKEREFQKQIESVSHDLRTPLTVILGYLKLLKKSRADQLTQDQELSEIVRTLEKKADSMYMLVAQFYDFSRTTRQNPQASITSVDISRSLREFFMENYQLLEQAQLLVSADIPKHPAWILGDETILERIFFNLFQNASRYAHHLFSVRFREGENHVSILFMNDTTLLQEEDIPHLFDRFYMRDPSRTQGGTGLGLTIAKSLAEELGGTLKAELLQPADARIFGPDAEEYCRMICFTLRLKRVQPIQIPIIRSTQIKPQ